MRSQPERDAQTLLIARALLLFLGVVLLGVAVAVAGELTGAWGPERAVDAATVLAVAAGVLYLVPRRR